MVRTYTSLTERTHERTRGGVPAALVVGGTSALQGTSVANLEGKQNGRGVSAQCSVMPITVRGGHRSPSPYSPSATSPILSTDTTCSPSAVLSTITPCV